VGDEYPSASILGIDLSPIQPLWVPPNVRFRVDDAESSWLDKENLYDLVHARHITSAIKDFPKLIKTAYKYVPPLFPAFEFTGSIRGLTNFVAEQAYQTWRLDRIPRAPPHSSLRRRHYASLLSPPPILYHHHVRPAELGCTS